MRILITNDDGIHSPTLKGLVEWAASLGEVTVVAPRDEQSGKSQSIDFRHPLEIKSVALPFAHRAYTVSSTPADCVRFAILGLDIDYDLVISGVNLGYNLGHDIAYSGTVAASLEAARLGIKSLAFSAHQGLSFDDYKSVLSSVFDYVMKRNLLGFANVYNINLVTSPKDILITAQGGVYYTDRFEHIGGDTYVQDGEPYRSPTPDLSYDTDAVWEGYVSVTPMTFEKTDLSALNALKRL